jgi:hypothetical protein
MSEPKWIRFVLSDYRRNPNRVYKTKVWRVDSKDGVELGYIEWYSRWRCYTFTPLADTVYEKRCLRDIADFCEQETKSYREEPRT